MWGSDISVTRNNSNYIQIFELMAFSDNYIQQNNRWTNLTSLYPGSLASNAVVNEAMQAGLPTFITAASSDPSASSA
jgi:hypothetical protein